MAEYLSSWNDGVAKSGILEFVRPVTEEKRGSRCRLTGLRRLTTTGRWREKPTCPQPDFLAMRWGVSMRDAFKVVFDL